MEMWMLITLLALVMLVYLDPTMSVGATQKRLTAASLIKFSLLFSVVLLILTGLGMVTGTIIRHLTGLYSISYLLPVFAFLLLAVLGSYMVIRSARKADFQERLLSPITVSDYVRVALAWGLPIYLTGVVIGLTVQLTFACFVMIFGFSLVISLGGLMYGNRLGYRYMRAGSAIAGVAMFLLAICYIAPYAAQLQFPQP